MTGGEVDFIDLIDARVFVGPNGMLCLRRQCASRIYDKAKMASYKE